MVTTVERARLATTAAECSPDLSVVIVTFNVRDLLRSCLRSLLSSEGDFIYEVIVVDNCSSDGSVATVRSEFPGVEVVASQVNGGFAYGNNLGLVRARGRYALLLNPDTVLPKTALSDMVSFMDAHSDAGAAGPKLVRQDGSLDLACRRSFPTPEVSFYRMLGLSKIFPNNTRFARYNLTFLDPDHVVEVDSVAGAFMLVRGELLRQVGLLDESFFMYGEDLDWAFRIKQSGWKVYYNGRVEVLHFKGESSRQRSVKTSFEFYRAMLTFYRKHYARTTPPPVHLMIVGAIYARGALALMPNMVRACFQRAGQRLQVRER